MSDPTNPLAKSAKAAEEAVNFSSHPIVNFQVGRFQFKKSMLTLSAADAVELEELLETMPPMEASRVHKLDVAAAEALVRKRLEVFAGATKQIDSSIGERAPPPAVGIGKLGDSDAEPETKQPDSAGA